MDPRTYRFAATFTLGAPVERVHDVLVDLEHYSEWWPQVRAVGKLDDDHALVLCRSTLPYDLELVLGARSREVGRLEVGIEGPIAGWARFHLDELAPHATGPGRTALRFEQEVRAEAPAFVAASYVVRPVLVWNHHRMVAGLREGLVERLARDTRGRLGEGQPSEAIAAS